MSSSGNNSVPSYAEQQRAKEQADEAKRQAGEVAGEAAEDAKEFTQKSEKELKRLEKEAGKNYEEFSAEAKEVSLAMLVVLEGQVCGTDILCVTTELHEMEERSLQGPRIREKEREQSRGQGLQEGAGCRALGGREQGEPRRGRQCRRSHCGCCSARRRRLQAAPAERADVEGRGRYGRCAGCACFCGLSGFTVSVLILQSKNRDANVRQILLQEVPAEELDGHARLSRC